MNQSFYSDLFIRARERRDREPWSIYAIATERLAEHLLESTPPPVDHRRHAWRLEQGHLHSKYFLTLAGWYRITEDERFAQRAWEFLDELLGWETWCIDPCGFDLLTGGTSVALMLALDWLEPWLSAERRAKIVNLAEERIFGGYLRECPPDKAPQDRAWWYCVRGNWNAVCNGGVLCLALVLQDESARGRQVVALAEEGLKSFIDALPDDGGCVEGVGYWQAVLIYLLQLFLTWERVYGKPHPAMSLPALNEGLSFPFDFTPESAPIGFCDANFFLPAGTLFALTARTGQTRITAEIGRRQVARFKKRKRAEFDPYLECRPDEISSLLFAEKIEEEEPPRPPLQVYPGIGWSLFRLNDLTLSFRAGNSDVPHGMFDLCAVNLARNGVVLLGYVENWPYPLGWFNQPGVLGENGRHASRKLFPEDTTTTKNSLLINGVGQFTRCPSLWGRDDRRVWCDATQAYPWYARKVSRTVENTDKAIRLTDEFETEKDAWHELRFHSRGEFRREGDAWMVEHRGQHARLQFSSEQELHFVVTEFTPSVGIYPKWNVLRVMPAQPALASILTTEIS